jgi:hypothetical protein
MTRRILVLLVAVGCFVAAASDASGARPRPDDSPPAQIFTDIAPNALHVFNDYAVPAQTYASRRAVVHYVVRGIDAPPLNDDNANAVPDYVERVADAADAAISYYESRGFAPIRVDAGGPDRRPDIYISRFAPGYFGVAFPAVAAEGGAFAAVSNALDPSSTRSLGSLYGTVAHELFHLVQFSYFDAADDPPLEAWALEGMAAAMENRVYPDLSDIVSTLQLRRWFAAPSGTITNQSYGSQLLWRYLDEHNPHLLPAYLEAVAQAGAGGSPGMLATAYERETHRSFETVFSRFATWAAVANTAEITPLRRLEPRSDVSSSVAPLAVHYLRISRSTRTIEIERSRNPVAVTAIYQLAAKTPGTPPEIRRFRPRAQSVRGTVLYSIPDSLRGNDRYELAMLVLSNGSPTERGAYRLTTR